MYEQLKQRFYKILPKVDFCSLRCLEKHSEILSVRQNIVEPPRLSQDIGAMITVMHQGGLGYAATSDLSETGLNNALQRACHWAAQTRQHSVTDYTQITMPHPHGHYPAFLSKPWTGLSLADKLALLQQTSEACRIDQRIVDWSAELWHINTEQWYLTNAGGELVESHSYLIPDIHVTAHQNAITQRRSLYGRGFARQGGLENLEHLNLLAEAKRIAEETLQLLAAPNCPSDTRDLVLAPDQMILQIHESIGHPLELDRILGDERNYAGTSFVTLDMFGDYLYGSKLLNITFDPSHPEQLASYRFDDEGATAEKTFIIREGRLERPLGGVISQARADLPGVANARADGWQRPPIDRMANLNLEAGDSSFQDIISAVEKGIFMQTNRSWSIDDSRNKFQFGCEWGQLIENGELTQVVKNPNYRGISATFWRNLTQVGNSETFSVMGSPYCGKGEPNQLIQVGHASPVCRFNDVAVFGGV